MPSLRHLRLLALPLLALPLHAAAQNPADSQLHALRTILHDELDKAELCLEFDRALAPIARNKNGATIRLDSKGKNLLSAGNPPNIAGALLCMPPLDYQQEYRLNISDLRGANNEKLSAPYSLSFTTPARRPSLAIAGDNTTDDIARWQGDAPSLRAVNVADAHVDLYHITNAEMAAEAWTHRRQTTLAPSESIYFARDKGVRVGQGDVTFDVAANKNNEKKPVIATEKTLAPGLYLMAATAAPPAEATPSSGLAPQAAKWFLLSNLKIRATKTANGFYVFAEDRDAQKVMSGIAITLMDRNRQILAQAVTDNNGVVFVPTDSKKMESAAILMANATDGNIDFYNLSTAVQTLPVLPAEETEIRDLRAFYAPNEKASITLATHELHNRKIKLAGSDIRILYADNSLYSHFPVPDINDDRAALSVTMPASGGEWRMEWVDATGRVLDSGTFHVSTNPDTPSLNLSADRKMISDVESAANITINAVTNKNRPMPFIAGRVVAKWVSASKLFNGWDDYSFGVPGSDITATTAQSHFITDAEGVAHLRMNLTPPENLPPASAAAISIIADPALGIVTKTPPVLLPVKPHDFVIGIKPLIAGGRFAENSLARFSIIALDSEGRRRGVSGLSYQVYDEGRSFEWYPAEGSWSYKPLQLLRRLGGKNLSLNADGADIAEWPVTAGKYRMDIVDNEGVVVARTTFNAGWGMSEEAERPATSLSLDASTATPRTGIATNIHFKLDQPAVITASVADDQMRQFIHQPMPQGDNHFTFTPEAGWGDRLIVRVENQMTGAAGTITLGTTHNKTPRDTTTDPVFDISGKTPATLTQGDNAQITLNLQSRDDAPAPSWHVALSSDAGLKLSDNVKSPLVLRGKNPSLSFGLKAAQAGAWDIKLDITGSGGFHETHRWPVLVNAIPRGKASAKAVVLEAHQSLTVKNPSDDRDRKPRALFISNIPYDNAPALLASLVQTPPITITEIATRINMLQRWRAVIVNGGLMPETMVAAQQRHLAQRLILLQNTDGGFPGVSGSANDIASTAAALVALNAWDAGGTKQAAQKAAQWLKHQLENTWFDEAERPQRAAALAALATTRKLDAASLHYFSDTSSDKALPPLASLQLAYAFSTINDHDKSNYWLSRGGVQKGDPDISTALLAWLIDAQLFNMDDALPALRKTGERLSNDGLSAHDVDDYLMALAAVQQHAQPAHVTINGTDKDLRGLMAFAIEDKPATLRNPDDKPVYVSELRYDNAPAQTQDGGTILRRLYSVNGQALGDISTLQKGSIYFVVLEGNGADEAKPSPILIHETGAPALSPLGCAISGASDDMGWIKELAITPPADCITTNDGLDITIATDGEQHGNWRVGYFAKAEWAGDYARIPATLYANGRRLAEERAKNRMLVK